MGPSQGDHTHNHAILWTITLHPKIQQTFSAGTHVEEENMHLEQRPTQQKAGGQGKGDKI